MTTATTYPVRVRASLDAPLSRWLWLVKWLLAVPHYVVLVFLWLAFVVLSVVAFVAILCTERYPRWMSFGSMRSHDRCPTENDVFVKSEPGRCACQRW